MTTSVRVPVKRPTYYENFSDFLMGRTETKRVCSTLKCEAPATVTRGYYLVESRRVRVWVCKAHATTSPLTLLPTPRDIRIALREEQKHLERVDRSMRITPQPERNVSVRVLTSAGHGEPLPFDRVAAFRWEPVPASARKPRKKGRAS